MKSNSPGEFLEPESKKKHTFEKWNLVDWVLRIICIFILSTVATAVRGYLNINKDWDWAFFLIAFLLGFQAPKLFRKKI